MKTITAPRIRSIDWILAGASNLPVNGAAAAVAVTRFAMSSLPGSPGRSNTGKECKQLDGRKIKRLEMAAWYSFGSATHLILNQLLSAQSCVKGPNANCQHANGNADCCCGIPAGEIKRDRNIKHEVGHKDSHKQRDQAKAHQ